MIPTPMLLAWIFDNKHMPSRKARGATGNADSGSGYPAVGALCCWGNELGLGCGWVCEADELFRGGGGDCAG